MILMTLTGTYLLIASIVFVVALRMKPPWMSIKPKWLLLSSLLWGKHVITVLILNGEKNKCS